MKKFDVVGLGSILVDELTILPQFPKADTKVEILKSQKQLGGPVPTALKALTKLGLSTSFIGKIGDDKKGRYIKSNLGKFGINTSYLIEEKKSFSGYAQVWIDSKTSSRTIAYSAGNLNPIAADEIDLNNMAQARIIHIDGRNHGIAYEIIEACSKKNTIVSIDTGNYREETLGLLEWIDIAIMPKSFANKLIGDFELEELILKIRLLYQNPKLIVITDGKNGSVATYENKIYRQKAFEVKTFDTTGAGDIHSAGVIYGILQNWGIEKILEFAAALAAYKCQYLGNLTLPKLEEVEELLNSKDLLSIQ